MICLILTVFVALFAFCLLFKLYLKFTIGWCRSQTCLVGKTALVTGANSGIGYETVLDFAKRGARVILACRDEQLAENARAKIIEETSNENVVVQLLDLSSYDSVRSFAKKINETEDRLDILVNNAGASGLGNKRSEDGYLLVMQINYFSAFLLTVLLIGKMKKNQSRVVNVSSELAKFAFSFDLAGIDEYPGNCYDYINSKLCIILFTIELAKKLEGTGITTYSVHPGTVQTRIWRNMQGLKQILSSIVAFLFYKTSKEGAQTTIYCSVAKGIEHYNGRHFGDCKVVTPFGTTMKSGLSEELWDATLLLVDLKPDEISF